MPENSSPAGKQGTTGGTAGASSLGNADFKILIAALTFFGLLAVLLLPDGCIDRSLIGPDWVPLPIPE
jgi:hypothetical protein